MSLERDYQFDQPIADGGTFACLKTLIIFVMAFGDANGAGIIHFDFKQHKIVIYCQDSSNTSAHTVNLKMLKNSRENKTFNVPYFHPSR